MSSAGTFGCARPVPARPPFAERLGGFGVEEVACVGGSPDFAVAQGGGGPHRSTASRRGGLLDAAHDPPGAAWVEADRGGGPAIVCERVGFAVVGADLEGPRRELLRSVKPAG